MAAGSEIDILLRQATAARQFNAIAEANALYRRVLELDPTQSDAVLQLVALARREGRPQDALPVLEAAAHADPARPEWWIGYALLLNSLGRHADAITAYDRAIVLCPREPNLHHARAAVLLRVNRYADALDACEAAIALRSDEAETHVVRAEALRRLLRYDDALAACDRAIEIQEDHAGAWHAKALLLLTLGRYREGWELFEWRNFIAINAENQRIFPLPFWDGSPRGERVLLTYTEQGAGDAIQFYRFVIEARRQGPVVLVVPQPLARLLETQPGAPVIATGFRNAPRFDVHCSMLSLPFLLETDAPPAVPYLRADPAIVAEWKPSLPVLSGKLRVGIVWAGSKLHKNDHNRSMSLATMLNMLDQDVTIISLQKDIPDSDRGTLRDAANVLDLSESLTDYADTAAVIVQLDLVITVDTSVAHLAGALGAPVWVLLATPPHWAWLLDRDDSPWYPSARLFRQDQPGDWNGVASRVRAALKGMIVSA